MFFLFMFDDYDAHGGPWDCHGIFDTIDQAKRAAHTLNTGYANVLIMVVHHHTFVPFDDPILTSPPA